MTAAHQPTITAVIGATGGAGTTRTIVEVATTLARTGADVAVFDAAVGSQGLRPQLLSQRLEIAMRLRLVFRRLPEVTP